MPKFNEHEKQHIRELLLNKGKELFVQYGLKKTSIDDIVQACGIAKGSFYRFFPSKEELYYEILRQEEAFTGDIIAELKGLDLPPAQLIEKLFYDSFQAIERSPFLSMVMRGYDWAQLIRKLPPEAMEEHTEADQQLGRELFAKWQKEGKLAPLDPDVITGMLRAVLLLSQHRQELGPLFDDIIVQLIRSIALGISAKPEKAPRS
ncbi:TetR/AcrR family transcriptional regulator [Paenibacillus turpanensis]|uniref:TetR/AcrR family transcriptional regulator n=1 Tax=Paenibacillus turpanensis TaxID=2689078 RepID=UPI00140A2708|nr:TetR/AcrR family transcriptional regulator [Paenibacillus turpanensis]